MQLPFNTHNYLHLINQLIKPVRKEMKDIVNSVTVILTCPLLEQSTEIL